MRTTPIKRTYSNFRGVDFANDPSIVLLSRSPDALNVWKNYQSTQGSCIETRPGYQELANFENQINGIYIFNNKALVHAGTNLILWDNFPNEPESSNTTVLKSNMNDSRSAFAIFNEKLYIVDGLNYLVYDGNTLQDVSSDNPYIPTTTISRSPSGGGEPYQAVNVLQPLRKNSFVGDGTSTEYYLDTTGITEVTEVKVNGTVVSDYTVNASAGKVTFTTPPSASVLSDDNVVITFSKIVTGYNTRISKCTKMVVFDRRIFYSGNPDFPNAIFHCELNNPEYVSDLAYYQDGTDESEVKSLVVGNNVLWVFKEQSQERDTIFFHTATSDIEGKVYPNFQGNVSTGCYSDAINYKDDIVFISKTGLEGISSNDIASQQLLTHKSSLVDNKMINEENFDESTMVEWNGYLMVLVNSHIYLADIRQIYQGINGYEYEWYYWELNNDACLLKEYKGNLYIGSEDGSIYVMQGTNDNGDIILSYWTTPMDNFGFGNMYKTTNKRGGVAKIKTLPNGKIKLKEKTNKRTDGKYVNEYSSGGFDYGNMDYSNFAYTTDNVSNIVYKIKEKKFLEIALKFYSDEKDKPFGIYSAILEAFVGGYVKR